MKDLEITQVAVVQLKPSPQNARSHSPKQVTQISQSIAEFGFVVPALIDKAFNIIAGHGRFLAAQKLKFKTIPTIQVEHLSETQIRAFMLADNKVAQNADWDIELLQVELEFLSQVDIDMDVNITGFTTPEIDIVFGAADEDSIKDIAVQPLPDNTDTVSRTGDLWQCGPHRLICGDCRSQNDFDLLMAGATAAMIITDPPYNVAVNGHVSGLGKNQHAEFAMASGEMTVNEFIEFLKLCLIQLARVSDEGSLHYIFMDWRHMQELLTVGNDVYDSMLNLCVWAKTNGGMGSLYRSQHELVFVFKKGSVPHQNNVELGKHGRNRTNVWTYPGVNSFGKARDEVLAMHPTVKPVQLIANALLDVTKHKEIVVDGFMGSGTTLIAAEQTGRVAYGVEYDPRYTDVALRRWMELTGKEPVHSQTGKTFSELRATQENASKGVKS